MSAIDNHLAAIQNAVYGKDVRSAIHDAIEQCYTDTSTAETAATQAAALANTKAGLADAAATNANNAATSASSTRDLLRANIHGSYNYLLDAVSGYYDSSGSVASLNTSSSTSCVSIPVTPGDHFKVAVGCNYSNSSRPWAVVDAGLNVLRRYAPSGITSNQEYDWRETPLDVFITESEAAYLLVNIRQGSYPGGYVTKVNDNTMGFTWLAIKRALSSTYSVKWGLSGSESNAMYNGVSIDNSGFGWVIGGNNHSFIAEKTEPMAAIEVIARAGATAQIAFLKSVPETYTNESEVDYVDGTGLIETSKNQRFIALIPEGTNYIYIASQVRGVTRTPVNAFSWFRCDEAAVIAGSKDRGLFSLDGTIPTGSIFFANGRLYRATASIANATEVVPGQEGADGVNCVETTIAAELTRLWNAINAL